MSILVEHCKSISSFYDSEIWFILNPIEEEIKQKIISVSIPLSKCNIDIKRGVLTGLNEAFILDEAKRKYLIEQDEKNAEIIRPLIRGRDVKRFKIEYPGLYLLNIHNGIPGQLAPIDIDDYPVAKTFMTKYINKLKKRKDQGITAYNLRSCSYLDDFYKPKIIYPETTQHANFVFDKNGIFIDKTCFMMLTDYPYYITCTLSSKLFEFAYKRYKSSILCLEEEFFQVLN